MCSIADGTTYSRGLDINPSETTLECREGSIIANGLGDTVGFYVQ
jgi:hypothetical protein